MNSVDVEVYLSLKNKTSFATTFYRLMINRYLYNEHVLINPHF